MRENKHKELREKRENRENKKKRENLENKEKKLYNENRYPIELIHTKGYFIKLFLAQTMITQ